MLYPKSNKFRDVYSLNGVWSFAAVADDYLPDSVYKEASPMAVPASYNDIVTDRKLKDHEGKVLYERSFSVPVREGNSYRLRIGATSHKCDVYLNGKLIGHGINGFYPIDLPLDELMDENRLSVIIDNRLSDETLPVGEFKDGRQVYHYDFYNYTGIHRDVLVYSLPEKCIKDVTVTTVIDGDYSAVKAEVDTDCESITYTVKDRDGNVVAKSCDGNIRIESPILWDTENPYLYTLIVETECDRYDQRFGIRKVQVKDGKFLLNDKPVYFKGFGMHEDFFVIGKANNNAVTLRNFECMKWICANSFRTSHYPYSEDVMDLADEYGFMVIDEVPAVGMNRFNGSNCFGEGNLVTEKTKALHKELIDRLIARDKNHPCVVMLSVGNEPATEDGGTREYFKDIVDHARSVTQLPITLVHCGMREERLGDLPDVISINRYYSWYYNRLGDLTDIPESLIPDLKGMHDKYNKPIMLTEFGADTIEGLHSLPADVFSEEYQRDCIAEYGKVFDSLDFVIGEQVWNFADFQTKQGLTRIRGNRKGVFTKDRQPKFVAHFLRERWSKK